MDKYTIKQVFMLVISSIIIYFSGLYLMSIGSIQSLVDGLIVMIFFFAVFPFLSISTRLSSKLLKGLTGARNY
jgi:hypothetical protein